MGDQVTKAVAAVAALIALLGLAPTAQAQDRITIGMYAPTVPFSSPGQRLTEVTALARHLSTGLSGVEVTGRVFARAGALVAAMRRGTVQVAVIDAPYAAARGLPYKVLAAGQRRGSATARWVVVAGSGIGGLADLAGKQVVVPRIGARRAAFVTGALLEGEVAPRYFSSITAAPDPQSAVTMVTLGRAAAALVPASTRLSGGARQILALRAVGWPMLVAAPATSPKLAAKIAARARSFSGSVFSGFTSPGAGRYTELRASFGTRHRRGPMVIPKPARLAVAGLLGKRSFTIEVADLHRLARESALIKRRSRGGTRSPASSPR